MQDCKHNYFDRRGYDYGKWKSCSRHFQYYFADITKTLKLKKHPNFDGQSLFSITDYFKNNESVIKIKENYNTQENSFSFTLFSKEDILKAIKSLSSNKASPIENIPIKILKNSIHIYLSKITNTFNECLINGKFPDTLQRETIMKRKTIAQWVCSQLFQKCLKSYYLNKLMTICKVNSQSILQVSAKTTVLKMLYWLWLKNGKLFWIKNSKLVLFLWICQKCLIP